MKSQENQEDKDRKQSERDANRDPLSGAAGAHPVGTGVGAAAGGAGAAIATGAAIGTVAGPVGTAVGAAVGAAAGAVAGGLAGKSVAEGINPTVEHGYWRANYAQRPYVRPGASYDEYAPAYQYGWESRAQYGESSFDDVEPDLEREWNNRRGSSNLDWANARDAVGDSYRRGATSRGSELQK